jgi:S1-C subfamily serine protease
MFLKFLVAPILAFSVLAPFSWFGRILSGPARMEDRVANSLYRITGSAEVETMFGTRRINYSCTGFQVAPKKIMTAAHCVGDDMKADGIPVKVISGDKYFDLALLEGPSDRPILQFREREVQRWEMLKSLGYGYGWNRLTVLDNKVILTRYKVVEDGPVGIVVQGGYIGGMSGGPLVDLDGKVVGVVQRSNSQIGYSVGATIIKAFLLDSGDDGVDIGFVSSGQFSLIPVPYIQ